MISLQWLRHVFPLLDSLSGHGRREYVGDLIAGLIVAVMLVPQAMAYAMLAGLPPQVGLYASVLPLLVYGLLGTSTSLAVGPVAMVSLIVLSGVRKIAPPESPEFFRACLTLALMVGVLHLVMGALRLGFLVNLISHPVLVGFTSAAAIVIGVSQIKHLTGAPVDGGDYPYQLIANTIAALGETKLATLGIGVGACALLLLTAFGAKRLLIRLGVGEDWASIAGKLGPLVAVLAGALLVYVSGLHSSHSVAIVGQIPAGLPTLTMPDLEWSQRLVPLAFVVTLVGYMESISVAKALATRRREKVDPNRELLALGMANVGAAFTGGYPVTGGFSRSMVNFAAGAVTPLAGIFTALFVAFSVLFLTPLFSYIPNAVLGAIIIVAVAPLVDLKKALTLWQFNRPDAFALIGTFFAVLIAGIELGILIGLALTVIFLLAKVSRPHVAEVGRIPGTEHFRNVHRHQVDVTEGVLALRIDESLTFVNAPFLESYVMAQVADRPAIRSVLLIASGINHLDATGLESLERIRVDLESSGITLYLSDVKGPVTDQLTRAGFDRTFVENHIFQSADVAFSELFDREI